MEGKFKTVTLASNLKPANPDDVTKKEHREGKAFLLFEEVVKGMEKQEMNRFQNRRQFGEINAAKEEPRQNVGERVATLGSQEQIHIHKHANNTGMFSSVLMAYNYHWGLRTSPDDWWFCVIKKVAKAIDNNSKKAAVRKFFVNHKEGKETLQVNVDATSIYGIDYAWFFNEMSKKIEDNVKVPGYVDAITANFSTTTPVQKITSQITLMSSVQEFFEFCAMFLCGIPYVEMLGTDQDWEKLLVKARELRHQLKPIMHDIKLSDEWWSTVETVFTNLLATYQGNPDKEWWSHIMTWKKAFGSGMSSGFEGWIVDFLEDPGLRKDTSEFSGGLVTVPLIFRDIMGNEDTAALVAGMMGFTLQQDGPKKTSVQPFQGWSLLLPENSPFRRPMEE